MSCGICDSMEKNLKSLCCFTFIKMDCSPKFISYCLRTDVTALCCVNNVIIAASGNWISVFDVSSQELLSREELLRHQNIHGLVRGPGDIVVAFGSRQLCVFSLSYTRGCFRLLDKVKWRVQDWVLSAHWLEGGDTVALLTAHNVVSLWDWRTRERLRTAHCQEKCLLYCGSLYGSSWEDLVAMVGTVFQEVVVWCPRESAGTDAPVLHRLQGHNGAIFSVVYDGQSRRICSTSDDRSVRVWCVEGAGGWGQAVVSLRYTMFAHLARVWRCLFLDHTSVVSVGEDSQVCVWSAEGSLLKRWRVHQGAGVRSVSYCPAHDLLVTGGVDGGVSLWPAAWWRDGCGDCAPLRALPPGEKPRRVGLLAGGRVAAVTSAGRLLTYEGAPARWTEWHCSQALGSYCLFQVSPCRRRLALASFHGSVTVFTERGEADGCYVLEKTLEVQAVDGRIFSLHWLDCETILTCGPQGRLDMWKISRTTAGQSVLLKQRGLELPASKERWTTAAVLHGQDLLVCGDRLGGVHSYDLRHDTLADSFPRLHGCLGVCSLSAAGDRVWSTGRDRTLRLFEARAGALQYLHADKLPMEWCAGTVFHRDMLLVLGFTERQLVVWSPGESQAVVQVPCGGGHRSWDCALCLDDLVLVFVKSSLVHRSVTSLGRLVRLPLQAGLHGREVNAGVLLPGPEPLLLSAGEDTTLRVVSLLGRGAPCPLVVLRSHISSVRALACWRESDRSSLVFSAGGRAEMRVWRVSILPRGEGAAGEVLCQEVARHMLRPEARRQAHGRPQLLDPETRYMDVCCLPVSTPRPRQEALAVFAACSDAFVRLLVFEPSTSSLSLVGSSGFHGRCVLKVSALTPRLALSLSTDGTAAFWDLGHEAADGIPSGPASSARLHGSGINACDWTPVGVGDATSSLLLVTGGDDNSLVGTRLEVGGTVVAPTRAWSNSTAHAAQITGVQFARGGLLLSVALDQRVVVWAWSWEHTQLSVHALGAYCSALADVHGLQACHHGGRLFACLYGRGMEVLEVQLNNNNEDNSCSSRP